MSLILKVGRYYVNGRGDFFGPMVMAAANLWLDQYDTGYTTDGKVQNHVKGSLANLVEEVTAGYICIKHNSLSERVAELENAVSGERVREALRQGIRAYVNTLENGRDRILFLGGECDSLDYMEANDPWLIEAKAALAALPLAAQPEGK